MEIYHTQVRLHISEWLLLVAVMNNVAARSIHMYMYVGEFAEACLSKLPCTQWKKNSWLLKRIKAAIKHSSSSVLTKFLKLYRLIAMYNLLVSKLMTTCVSITFSAMQSSLTLKLVSSSYWCCLITCTMHHIHVVACTFFLSNQQPIYQVDKPGVMLVATQCSKPHLPVQTRLMRSCVSKKEQVCVEYV